MTQRRFFMSVVAVAMTGLLAADATAQPYFVRTQVLAAPNANNNFAAGVDVDGEWTAAGATGLATVGATSAVYIYRKVAGVWTPFQELACPVTNTNFMCNRYGRSVAISGATLAVSNGGSNNYDGLIWVYTWNGTSWTLQTTLSGRPAG